MNISKEQLKEEVKELDIEISKHFKDTSNPSKSHLKETPNRGLIRDGIVNIDEYYNSQIKIMWVLKEPYDIEGNGFWSMQEGLNGDRARGEKADSQSTWHPIIYSTYGILNNYTRLEKIPVIGKQKGISGVLRQIAYINVQKLPAKTRTNDTALKIAYDENKGILIKQINTYKPDIIIGGRTLHLFKKDLNINDADLLEAGHFTKENRIYINTLHPAQTKIKRAEYVNKIIERAEQWKDIYLH